MVSRSVASQYELPERYTDALRAGIRFFAVEYPKKKPAGWPERVYGFFDVSAKEQFVGNKATYRLNWMAGPESCIKFEQVDNRGTMVGFIPDDIYSHNQIMLASEKSYWPGIIELHKGIGEAIPGSDVRRKIECLHEAMYHDVPIYRLVNPDTKREVAWYYTREEAEERRNATETRLTRGGLVQHQVQPWLRCKIVEGKTERYRPEILENFQQNQRNQFGWTNPDTNPDFRALVLSPAQKLYDERTKAEGGDVLGTAEMTSAQMSKMLDAKVKAQLQILLKNAGLTPAETNEVRREVLAGVEEMPDEAVADEVAQEVANQPDPYGEAEDEEPPMLPMGDFSSDPASLGVPEIAQTVRELGTVEAGPELSPREITRLDKEGLVAYARPRLPDFDAEGATRKEIIDAIMAARDTSIPMPS